MKGAITLTCLEKGGAHCCVAEDLSASGVFVYVPADSGLAVGNRVEVTLGGISGVGEASNLCGEKRYATVVRTQECKEADRPLLGAGLRFDQPLFLDPAPDLNVASV